MPSKTPRQARLMAMCAHQPERNRPSSAWSEACRGIPQSVAKEYNRSDQKSGMLRKAKPKKSK